MHKSKFISVFVAAVLVFSAIATPGCSKKDNTDNVSGSGAWYDYKQVDVTEEVDISVYDIGSVNIEFIGVVNERLIFTVSGSIVDDLGDGYTSWNEELKMITYDKQGNDPQIFDLYTLLDEQFDEISSDYICVDNIDRENDLIRIDFTASGPSGASFYRTCFDPATDRFSNLILKSDWDEGLNNNSTFQSIRCDGYSVSVDKVFDDQDFGSFDIIINIDSPSDEHSEILFGDLFPSVDYNSCRSIFRLEENKVLIEFSDYEGYHYYQLDLASKEVTSYTGDTSVLDTLFFWEGLYIEGIGNILRTAQCIKTVDLNEGTIGEYFDANRCNINQNVFSQLDIEYIDDNTIIMTGLYNGDYTSAYDVYFALNVYVLTRSDTDPNSGKEIITAASVYDISYEAAEGIRVFNEQSSTHRIVLDNRYNAWDIQYDLTGDETDLSSESLVYNRLMVDMMSGDGPDILLDAYGLLQLSNDQYLLDLSDIDLPDDMYANVVDAARVDGKLYNIPLSFSMEGITTDDDNVDPDQVGFTFDQYDGFVHDVCNGTDPTNLTRERFFMTILSTSGITDYRSEGFWELADFARDRYTEPYEASDYAIIMGEPVVNGVYYFTVTNPFYMFENVQHQIDDKVLLGLPSSSSEARNPAIDIKSSVAVFAGTQYADQCKEFISVLLSPEIQSGYDYLSSANPVTSEGVRSIITEMTDAYNQQVEYMLSFSGGIPFPGEEDMWEPVEAELFISVYESMIESASGSRMIDVEQSNIILEEMGAYFADQKTREEIVDIIEDRINTVINERG